jgi:phosphate transport system substrate-binding protein
LRLLSNSTSTIASLLMILALATVVVGGCSQPQTGGTGPAAHPPGAGDAPAQVQLSGAGATLPAPLYVRWFNDFGAIDKGVSIDYRSVGSGAGITQVTARGVDFGASDAILTASQLAAAPGLQMIPMVGAVVAVAYNLPGADQGDALIMNGAVLADIFLGRVGRWDDPAIRRLNPQSLLPSLPITVVHRSDSSGTTAIFADYLSSVSPVWERQVGRGTVLEWPTGVGVKGSDGVANTAASTPGAIGYVEMTYAVQGTLQKARLINAAGRIVSPTADGAQAAMADFAAEIPPSLAQSIVNAPGETSWPIAAYTYLLVYEDQSDCAKAAKVQQLIRWALTGGSRSAKDMGYVPLPDSVRKPVFLRLDRFTCNGRTIVG